MKGNRGLIKLVLLIVIALIVLGAYGFNLKDYIDSPEIQENLSLAWDIVVRGWNWLVETIKSFFPNR